MLAREVPGSFELRFFYRCQVSDRLISTNILYIDGNYCLLYEQRKGVSPIARKGTHNILHVIGHRFGQNSMVTLDAKIIKQLKNIYGLLASQLDGLAKNLTVRNFQKDEIVFDQDERATLVYLLLSGVARVSYNGHERQTIVSLLSP